MTLKQWIQYALYIAMIFVVTSIIVIPIGAFGYINVSDALIQLFATTISPIGAFLVGGISTAMADLYLGFSQYALFTFVIKGLEGCAVSYFVRKKRALRYPVMALVGIGVAVSYGIVDMILTQSIGVFFASFLTNMIQVTVCVIISWTCFPLFEKATKNLFVTNKK